MACSVTDSTKNHETVLDDVSYGRVVYTVAPFWQARERASTRCSFLFGRCSPLSSNHFVLLEACLPFLVGSLLRSLLMPSSTTSSNHTLSPSSTLIAGDDDVGHYSEIEFVEGVPYTRKRPSTSQVDALQASYELNRYPTREERRELANRVGM